MLKALVFDESSNHSKLSDSTFYVLSSKLYYEFYKNVPIINSKLVKKYGDAYPDLRKMAEINVIRAVFCSQLKCFFAAELNAQ